MKLATTFLAEMFDISGGSWMLILLVSGVATSFVRKHVSMLAATMLYFPCAILVSLLVNHLLVLTQVYVPTKLGDRLVWVIVATTLGNMAAIGAIVAAGKVAERTSRQAAS